MTRSSVAIIGGTGLDEVPGFVLHSREEITTPFGRPSEPIALGTLDGTPVAFLPRHGHDHRVPPHQINFRANLWALRIAGISTVIAVAAVGGITATKPGTILLPDQVIDYTYGREQTFSGHLGEAVTHVDFTHPYCATVRNALVDAAARANVSVRPHGVMGVTQGPRLESAAEVNRLDRDGCDVVGMTGMPEAALARELGLCYAAVTLVVNAAAGRGPGTITMEEIGRNLTAGMGRVVSLVAATLQGLAQVNCPDHAPRSVG